jgi:hypothetical protein
VKSEIRNPKSEARAKSESRRQKLPGQGPGGDFSVRSSLSTVWCFGWLARISAFGFLSDPGFRFSDLGRCHFQICFLILLASLPALAQDTNAPSRSDIQSFRIIAERNIFDPNRSNRSRNDRPRERERPSRTESFALLGTMSYEKGWFAFFDGTSSDFRKVVQPTDTIAGYKVADIAPDRVKLSANGQEVELRVGMQMKRQDEGEWKSGERADSLEKTSPATSSTTTAAEPSGTTSNGAESDILKRLMQQREQELNK